VHQLTFGHPCATPPPGWSTILPADDDAAVDAAPAIGILAVTEWRDRLLVAQPSVTATRPGSRPTASDGSGTPSLAPGHCSSARGVLAWDHLVVVSCDGPEDAAAAVAATRNLVRWESHIVGDVGPSFGTTIGPCPHDFLTVTALEAVDVYTRLCSERVHRRSTNGDSGSASPTTEPSLEVRHLYRWCHAGSAPERRVMGTRRCRSERPTVGLAPSFWRVVMCGLRTSVTAAQLATALYVPGARAPSDSRPQVGARLGSARVRRRGSDEQLNASENCVAADSRTRALAEVSTPAQRGEIE
jgi:hypothetical protein